MLKNELYKHNKIIVYYRKEELAFSINISFCAPWKSEKM